MREHDTLGPGREQIGLPWSSKAGRAWAARAWAVLCESLSYDDSADDLGGPMRRFT